MKNFGFGQRAVVMPKRIATVSTEIVVREVSHLDDSMLLLPVRLYTKVRLS